ncbi:MAG: hypothetical protein H7276_08160 [Caulobacter sp.]|nr:hypothetical protein [Vitreoscilla sp.]
MKNAAATIKGIVCGDRAVGVSIGQSKPNRRRGVSHSTAWAFQQRADVAMDVDAQQRHVEGGADDARSLQILQLLPRRVVAHHRDALVAPGVSRDRGPHATVVEAVAGVGLDEQALADAVRVEDMAQLIGRADLRAARSIPDAVGVGKVHRIEDVHVAVDDRMGQVRRGVISVSSLDEVTMGSPVTG